MEFIINTPATLAKYGITEEFILKDSNNIYGRCIAYTTINKEICLQILTNDNILFLVYSNEGLVSHHPQGGVTLRLDDDNNLILGGIDRLDDIFKN